MLITDTESDTAEVGGGGGVLKVKRSALSLLHHRASRRRSEARLLPRSEGRTTSGEESTSSPVPQQPVPSEKPPPAPEPPTPPGHQNTRPQPYPYHTETSGPRPSAGKQVGRGVARTRHADAHAVYHTDTPGPPAERRAEEVMRNTPGRKRSRREERRRRWKRTHGNSCPDGVPLGPASRSVVLQTQRLTEVTDRLSPPSTLVWLGSSEDQAVARLHSKYDAILSNQQKLQLKYEELLSQFTQKQRQSSRTPGRTPQPSRCPWNPITPQETSRIPVLVRPLPRHRASHLPFPAPPSSIPVHVSRLLQRGDGVEDKRGAQAGESVGTGSGADLWLED